MVELTRTVRFGGLFVRNPGGALQLVASPQAPASLRDPATGQALQIATVEVAGAICPSCEQHAHGGFVSFVADLRMVFACPKCEEMVWVPGA